MSEKEYPVQINEEELAKFQEEFGEETFTAGIGAEAILEILKSINLEEEKKQFKQSIVMVATGLELIFNGKGGKWTSQSNL